MPVGGVFCEASEACWGGEDGGDGPAFDGAGGVFLEPGAVMLIEECSGTASACYIKVDDGGRQTGWDTRSYRAPTQKGRVPLSL